MCLGVCLGVSGRASLFRAANTGGSIERKRAKSLPAELFAHFFSFSLAVGWRKRKRERQKEDGRNETKTCSQTENEER